MIFIPLTPEIQAVARRVIWFEEPERALQNPVRFLAYAMTYATHEDMQMIRHYVTDEQFREALDQVPPGIIDQRSWAYWNLKLRVLTKDRQEGYRKGREGGGVVMEMMVEA